MQQHCLQLTLGVNMPTEPYYLAGLYTIRPE